MKSKPRENNTCTNNRLHKCIVSVAFNKSSFIFLLLLSSFMYSFPLVSTVKERRRLFSVRFRSRRASVPISCGQNSLSQTERLLLQLVDASISDQTSQRLLYVMFGRIDLRQQNMYHTQRYETVQSYSWSSHCGSQPLEMNLHCSTCFQ